MASENRLLELARQDLGNARDNLARARAAAQRCYPSREWGESGQTLNEIIVGYESWEREALKAVKDAERLGAKQ